MLRRLSLLLCALLLAATASATVAPVAAGQEDEVFVDPGSPSGKEYELPIDRARERAGTSTKKRSGAQKAPLFGEGVDNGAAGTSGQRQSGDTGASGRDKGSGDTASKARAKRAKERAGAKERAATEREAQAAAQREAAEERAAEIARTRALRAEAAAPEGGTGLAVIIGAGIAIVLIGGLVGLWLRRRAAP